MKQGFEEQMTPELCLREQVDIRWRRVGSISSKMDEMKKGRAVRKCVVCTVLRKNTGCQMAEPFFPCYGHLPCR